MRTARLIFTLSVLAFTAAGIWGLANHGNADAVLTGAHEYRASL